MRHTDEFLLWGGRWLVNELLMTRSATFRIGNSLGRARKKKCNTLFGSCYVVRDNVSAGVPLQHPHLTEHESDRGASTKTYFLITCSSVGGAVIRFRDPKQNNELHDGHTWVLFAWFSY